jgi:DNA invertase Pin-like site-specific DNA recombinase
METEFGGRRARRPAQARKIDIIIVYKVDRLTRSLFVFSRRKRR